MKKFRFPFLTSLLAGCVLLASLTGCAGAKEPDSNMPVGNADGEIRGESADSSKSGGSFWDKLAEAFSPSGGARKESPEADGMDVPMPMEPEMPVADGDSGDGEYSDKQENYRAGVLTGSEWRDLDHWPEWVSKLDDSNLRSIARSWQLIANHRIAVSVKKADGTPVKNAKAVLTDAADKELYRAVTDCDGNAYVFWNLTGNSQEVPAKVTVTAQDGTSASVDVNADTQQTDVTLDVVNSAVKLDLMFMVDTTGSMGDELNYLKAELQDVVTRVSKDAQIAIRTSVNFYRDEGDEYIVRYFSFKDDVQAAVQNIAAQSAAGGGDTPEAVHTALDNAVNGHAWDDGAVKLMFLVLDAAPHDDKAVKDSLTASLKAAAAAGIRIIPVVSSGSDSTCEVLFRTFAALTGGTYTYLTDDSGIGGTHEKPDVGETQVELLNDMLVRIIKDYCR